MDGVGILVPTEHDQDLDGTRTTPIFSLSPSAFFSPSLLLTGGMVAAIKSIEKWQELGNQLNINPEMLSKLFNSGQSGAKCRDEMVAYWEKHDNDASWEKLARALARMGENQLAEGIIKEHSLPKTTLVPKEELATTPKNEG